MNSSARGLFFSGFSFWMLVAALGIYLLFPLKDSLRLGIDLAGGTYITLEVQTEKALEVLKQQ